jgi:long-chain-fatty-acid--CoA ligase ACSBG
MYTDFSPVAQISTQTILESRKAEEGKNALWTTDIRTELPIFLTKEGLGSLPPITVIEMFENSIKEVLKEEALFVERGGKWVSWTWNHFQKEVNSFAKALISIGIEPYKTVNILGFNSPEWLTAFMGGIFGCVVPTGIYLTNNTETCVYIAEHSEAGCLVVDTIEQYKKYEASLNKLKSLKAVVFYGDVVKEADIKALTNPFVTLYTWKDFIEIGRNAEVDLELLKRKKMQSPGNCCNIVYTSGTTGQPKAVLLTHDNMTWITRAMVGSYAEVFFPKNTKHRIVSYLPLSHIAGQYMDILSKCLK